MKKFLKEMNFDNVKKYKKPCLITLSGLPGSGKTYVAKELSKDLGIFVLSNDYVRNYFYKYESGMSFEQIQKNVDKINKERLLKIILNRKSFVFDADLNTCEKFQRFIKISDMFNYELIKIKLNSNDDNNIDRILKRVMDYDMFDYNVIGDNVHYSSSYDRDTYYDIKSRKPQYIDDNYFDYVIDNFGTKEELKCKINEISTDIGSSLTLKK